MLIDPRLLAAGPNPIGALLATLALKARVERVEEGIYRLGHFNFDHEIAEEGWKVFHSDLPESVACYGVCDSIEQFLTDFGGALQSDPRSYCVGFTHVAKHPERAGEGGGWRWHKWGPYVGHGEPTTEYLDDEEGFADGVWTFHVLVKKALIRPGSPETNHDLG